MPEGLRLKYFVLNPESKRKGDPYAFASREALWKYAHVIENENPQLASEIRMWVNELILHNEDME